ncbi:MAG: transglycosylase SLT domain-containing protein [Caenibius sp.]
MSAVVLATPVQARSAAEYFRARAVENDVPNLLSRSEQDYYRSVFSAIDQQDWSTVQSLLAQKDDGPLQQVAEAEYFLAPTSPKIELPQLETWLSKGRDLPFAEKIGSLAIKRGATQMPLLPAEQSFVPQPYAPKRVRPRSIDDGSMPSSISSAILDRIKNDDPDGARQLLDGIDSSLSSASRAEWRQRVAWSYYIENMDTSSLAMAQRVSDGSGPWVAEGDWVAGLAAWRLNDCESAASSFEKAAREAGNPELGAAAYYWASRAYTRCRQPERSANLLRSAARMDETLYGMLASEQLGMALPKTYSTPDFSEEDWKQLRDIPNVRTAVALSQIGRDNLAADVLRHQARIGNPADYAALTRLARDLGLTSTQLWMAHNAPRGGVPDPASRYPTPKWQPVTGWEVDPALVYAHALQESNFRPDVVSPAGARGLMQIMPATARHHAPSLNMSASYSELSQPEVNMAYGQRTLESLRDSSGTQGLLPKVMAAYNAGLAPVTRWNTEINDQDDPLLWMESIPYWETRGYVAIVMRNYWMYERQAGNGSSPTRAAMAQAVWPRFPDFSGGGAVRLSAQGSNKNGY